MSEILNYKPEQLKLLREPFAANQISKLPKPLSRDAIKGKCKDCGGFHGLPAVHLDYVGHAALTDRLLNVDPLWDWQPLALDAQGLPLLDKDGGLWIRLTVCGMTRLGYGDAQNKTGGDAMKERIGDALRNAAMRFGAALDLWHKGDLHAEEDEPVATITEAQAETLRRLITDTATDLGKFLTWAKITNIGNLPVARFEEARKMLEAKPAFPQGKKWISGRLFMKPVKNDPQGHP